MIRRVTFEFPSEWAYVVGDKVPYICRIEDRYCGELTEGLYIKFEHREEVEKEIKRLVDLVRGPSTVREPGLATGWDKNTDDSN